MESVKIYVATNKNVDIVCPNCQSRRSLNLVGRDVPFSAETTCSCGHKYLIQFEKRAHYRKALDSTGLCSISEDSEDNTLVRIINISRSGLAFTKERGRQLNVGENVRLEFILDEVKVYCTVTIVSVLDPRVGAKFHNLDVHTQKLIGFYLMP